MQETRTQNKIVAVSLTLLDNNTYEVVVTKEFAPEYGGGSQVFRENGSPSLHRALDVAREMVTVSAGSRTDIPIARDIEYAEALRKCTGAVSVTITNEDRL